MLKIILSSGLYPHIAITDEFNSCKVNYISYLIFLIIACLTIIFYFYNNTTRRNLNEKKLNMIIFIVYMWL